MTKRLFALLLAVLMVAMPFAALAADSESAKESVVRMYVEHDVLYVWQEESTLKYAEVGISSIGTGFGVGEKGKPVEYFVTNRHVLACDKEDVASIAERNKIPGNARYEVTSKYYIILSNIEQKLPVDVVKISDRTDLAVVQINVPTTERKPISIRAFSDDSVNGEQIFTLGFPGAADIFQSDSTQDKLYSDLKQITKTSGIVSRILSHSQTGEGELLQTDAPIAGGNSGGPLVDKKGNLVGVNTYSINNTEIHGAVSSNEVIRLLEEEKIPYIKAGGLSVSHIALFVMIALIVLVIVLILAQKKSKPSAPKSTRYLVGESGAFAGKKIPLKAKMVIGRHAGKCQIVFPPETSGVSTVHCTIRFDGKTVTVTDEKSSYGTQIDGKPVQPGQPTVMHRGQKLQIGSQKQTFTLQS